MVYDQLIGRIQTLAGSHFFCCSKPCQDFISSLNCHSECAISRLVKSFVDSDLCCKTSGVRDAALSNWSPAPPAFQTHPLFMGRLLLIPPGIYNALFPISTFHNQGCHQVFILPYSQYQPFTIRVACATVESQLEVIASTRACGTLWP